MTFLRKILAAICLLLAIPFLIGGTRLLTLGGSAYYGLAGVALAVIAVLTWRGMRQAWPVAAAAWGATAIWSVIEAGFDPWALEVRLLTPTLLLIALFLVSGAARKARIAVLGASGAAALAALIAVPLLFGAPASRNVVAAPGDRATDWPGYGGDADNAHFTAARQVTPDNVAGLKVAWTYHMGTADLARQPGAKYSFQATPLKIGDTLYLCAPNSAVVALNAETGAPRWRFDPQVDTRGGGFVCRGVSYADTGRSGVCARRIIAPTVDARLMALDAETGRLCADFGTGGFVSLLDGIGATRPGFAYTTSPGVVIGNRIVVGGQVADAKSVDVPSGVIRAYDVVTGELAWAWDMGRPDRTGAPGPGETYTRGTPNAWAPLAADPALGLVFVPTGNPSPDFFGGLRRPFDETYGSAIVALDAATGRPRWTFQTVHHDLWDADLPAQPVLIDWPTPKGKVPALVQATKTGNVYVLDRRTGKPVVPVQEHPAPQGPVAGDRLSPTQPRSALNLIPPRLREADMWGLTPIDQMACRIAFRQARYDGPYTPPGLRTTINYPGAMGLFEWGGLAIDPAQGIAIANTIRMPILFRLVPRADAPESARALPAPGAAAKSTLSPMEELSWNPQEGTPYAVHAAPFFGPLFMPCQQPPWGELVAMRLADGKMLWRRPNGTGYDSGPMGIASRLPIPIGVPSLGGAVVTGGGLVFTGSTLDRFMRAYDVASGKELWRARLPAGGQATPMSYATASGRQFIVIAAGGHSYMGSKTGDSVIAYALPTGQGAR